MDPIADLLTCIRNANLALKPEISVPHSTIKESTVRILKDEGYLESFNVEGDVKRSIRIPTQVSGSQGYHHRAATDQQTRVAPLHLG